MLRCYDAQVLFLQWSALWNAIIVWNLLNLLWLHINKHMLHAVVCCTSSDCSPIRYLNSHLTPDPFWYLRVSPDPFWYLRVSSDPFWYLRVSPDPFWYLRVSPDPFWYLRVSPDPFWYLRVSSDHFLIFEGVPWPLPDIWGCPLTPSDIWGWGQTNCNTAFIWIPCNHMTTSSDHMTICLRILPEITWPHLVITRPCVLTY